MTLRERFCNNKRRLNRRVNRYLLMTAIVLLFLLNIAHLVSYQDRQQLHKEFQLSRQMLDARARIQIMVVEKNWDKLSEEEREFIRKNWGAAEYDRAANLDK